MKVCNRKQASEKPVNYDKSYHHSKTEKAAEKHKIENCYYLHLKLHVSLLVGMFDDFRIISKIYNNEKWHYWDINIK